MYDKQPLIELIRAKALKFGDFTLASGKKATYYLDGKQVTLDPVGARLVAEGILDLLAGPRCPRPSAACRSAPTRSRPPWSRLAGPRHSAVGFMVRKESKGHGTNQLHRRAGQRPATRR